MENMSLNLDYLKRHSLAFVCLILTVTVFFHLSTLPISPLVWMDDATITELGRLQFFSHTTDDSILLFKKDVIARAYHVLGPGVCELGFRMTGSFLAPRIFALTGFAVATFLLFLYLRFRTRHLSATLIAVLLFISSHYVTLSFRAPRPDCWTFVCCLISLLCIEYTRLIERPRFQSYLLWFVAGASTATSFFIWNASALLYPMIGIIGLESLSGHKSFRVSLLKLISACVAFGGVFLLVTLLFNLLPTSADDAGENRFCFIELLSGTIKGNIVAFLACLLKTPFSTFFICILLIYGLLHKNLLAIGICCTTIFVLLTRMYIFRFLYLEFMTIVCIGILLPDFLKSKNRILVHLSRGIAILAIVSSLLVMVVLRNIIPHLFTQVRSYPTLELEMNKVIGIGASVYTDTYQVYYAGRNLDWKMYRYAPENPILEAEHKYDLLEKCDFYITEALSPEMEEVLKAKGFFPFKVVSLIPPESFPRLQKLLVKLNCPVGYGPYLIFKRNLSLFDTIKIPNYFHSPKQLILFWFI